MVKEQGAAFPFTHEFSPTLSHVGAQRCGCRPAHQRYPLLGAFAPDSDFVGIEIDLLQVQLCQLAYPEAGGI